MEPVIDLQYSFPALFAALTSQHASLGRRLSDLTLAPAAQVHLFSPPGQHFTVHSPQISPFSQAVHVALSIAIRQHDQCKACKVRMKQTQKIADQIVVIACRGLSGQIFACLPAEGQCVSQEAAVLVPLTPTCAQAFQTTYNIAGGDAVFTNVAAAADELNDACSAYTSQVPLLGFRCSASCTCYCTGRVCKWHERPRSLNFERSSQFLRVALTPTDRLT
jgi:hypothetical protein